MTIKTVAICTAQTPFMSGGAEVLVNTLQSELLQRGYQSTIIQLPFKWYPTSGILRQAVSWRFLDVTEANGIPIDKVICTKFPSYYVSHPNKVIWLMHQHRPAYDLLGTEYSDFDYDNLEDREIIEIIQELDTRYISEAVKIFSQSQTVGNRLKKFNGLNSEVLYPPTKSLPFRHGVYGDFIFTVSRLDKLKRIDLLIESLTYTKYPIRVEIAGEGPDKERLVNISRQRGIEDRVKFLGKISDEELLDKYATCSAVYFAPFNEDYGYITIEAFNSRKPVITTKDSGGVTEFVEDGVTGFVTEPNRRAIAQVIDKLVDRPTELAVMGEQCEKRVSEINWDVTIEKLLYKS